MSTFKPLDGMRKKLHSTTGAYEGVVDQNGDTAFPAAALSATDVAGAQALVSADGNLASADVATTTGTPGEVRRISDGDNKGAIVTWAIPQGASAYTWCWWLWPQAAY